jgi:cytochrome c-type biogenesis protein CcmF
MTLLGELSLWVALAMAGWAAAACVTGALLHRETLATSGTRAVYATAAFAVLAVIGLLAALVRSDFSLEYVATYTASDVPSAYKMTALWASPPGTFLFTALALALLAAIVATTSRHTTPRLAPLATGALAAMTLALLTVVTGFDNPFARTPWTVPEGDGTPPSLQTGAVLAYAPLLYAGLASTAVPLALTIAALVQHQLSDAWYDAIRFWSRLSWLLLTLAAALGMRAAYVTPGASDRWAWSAVDSGVLLPWITLTALLHAPREGPRRPPEATSLAIVLTPVAALAAYPLAATGIVRGAMFTYFPHGFARNTVLLLACGLLVITTVLRLRSRRRRAATPPLHTPSAPLGRLGAHVAHAGLAVVAVATTAGAFRRSEVLSFGPGETRTITDPFGDRWQLSSNGMSRFSQRNVDVIAVAVSATHNDGPARDAPTPLLTAEERFYMNTRGPAARGVPVPGILSALRQDVSVMLAEVGTEERARVRVTFTPLVAWIWVGAATMTFGGILLLLPRPRAVEA